MAQPGDSTRLLELLARLYHGENRANMTPDEAAAIADTALNRTQLAGYPDTPEEVLLQPKQYQPLSPLAGNPASQANAATVAAFGPQDPTWNETIALAQYALQGGRKRGPYTHYYSGDIAPPWARRLQSLTKIGSHTFGVEKRRKKPPKKETPPGE